MKKIFSVVALSALIASPLTANHSEFADKPYAKSVSIKKEKGLFIRGLNCGWQLTKFFGGIGMIAGGFGVAACSCTAFTCGKCAKAIRCDKTQGFGGADDCCDLIGTSCGKAGAIGTPVLWYLGWKSMKSGWNGLTKN